MRTIVVDKIASVTQACGLGHEVRIATDNIPAEEGVVVVVEVLTSKANYNTLELTSGRMAKVNKGDIVVGALGHRRALFGFSGHVPKKVEAGDIIQMLNIGGVLGICDSANPDKGKPFDCRVLGVVLQFPYLGERIGVPARAGYRKLDYDATLDTQGVPVVALAGTCMEAGKTAAACAIVSRMRHRGMTVDVFKATGVSLRLSTWGLRSEVLRMKFEANSTASICISAGPPCGPGLRLPAGDDAAACLGATGTEKSPALASPCCFTRATQLTRTGSSCEV